MVLTGLSISNSAGLVNINYNNLTTTTQYRTLVQSGSCAASYSNIVTITVLPIVTVANAGADQHLCGVTSTSLSANQPTSGIGTWTQIAGPNTAIFSNPTAYNSTVSGLTTGTYIFKWTISNGVCISSQDDVIVEITASLVNFITNTVYSVCENQSVNITATPATGGTGNYQYLWQQSSDGINWATITGANTVQYSFTPSLAVTSLRRIVNALPCSQISNIAMVTTQASLGNNNLTASMSICNDSSTYIPGSLPTGGDGIYFYTWQSSIDGGTNWTTIAGATGKDYTPGALRANTLFRRIVRTSLCTGPQESISNITAITIKYKPTAIFAISPDTGCSPVTVHFQNQSLGNNATYLFSFGDGKDSLLNTLSSINHIYQSNTLVNLNTRLLATNECGTDSAFKIITIKPDFIQPALFLSDTSLCGPGNIVFTNNTKGGTPIFLEFW